MMYSTLIKPENHSLHAKEYQILSGWFKRRKNELGLSKEISGDPMDPHNAFNQAFHILCKEAETCWKRDRNYWPSPLQLSHAFFQLRDPVRLDNFMA